MRAASPSRTRVGAVSRLVTRFLAWSMLLLLGAVHGLPALHFAAIAHEVCAEHGELHHAEASSHASVSPVELGDELGGSARPANSSEGHLHEHCSTTAVGAERDTCTRSAKSAEVLPLLVAEPLLHEIRQPKTSLTPLDYAPKLAPPV